MSTLNLVGLIFLSFKAVLSSMKQTHVLVFKKSWCQPKDILGWNVLLRVFLYPVFLDRNVMFCLLPVVNVQQSASCFVSGKKLCVFFLTSVLFGESDNETTKWGEQQGSP